MTSPKKVEGRNAARDLSLGVRKSDLATSGRNVFEGADDRGYYARQTCQRTGAASEITTPGPSIGSLVWQLSPFIALGLVLLALFGRVR